MTVHSNRAVSFVLAAVLAGAPFAARADGFEVHVAIRANMAAIWPRTLECWVVGPAPAYQVLRPLYVAELRIGDDGKVSGQVAHLPTRTNVACGVMYESWFVSARGTLTTYLDAAGPCRAVNEDQTVRLEIYLRGPGC